VTCGALRRGCYEGAKGMRRFREQVDSCQGGELGEGIVILSIKIYMDQPLMGCPHR
jgi:hypothetical protein